MKRVKERSFLEFSYVVAEGKGGFRAAGFDKDGTKILDTETSPDQESVEREIVARLGELSNEFVGIDGAKSLFLKAFPEGFSSEFYIREEREPKLKAVALAKEMLASDRMQEMLSAGEAETLFEDVLKVSQKAGFLFSHYELMTFRDEVRRENLQEEVCRALWGLCYGPIFPDALASLVALLKPLKSAKWPIVTYFPYVLFPERHMFLKPEISKTCAERMGWDLEYDSEPNYGTYEKLLGLVEHMRQGIKGLDPEDNIDIQSMMYAVGQDGYVQWAMDQRSDG